MGDVLIDVWFLLLGLSYSPAHTYKVLKKPDSQITFCHQTDDMLAVDCMVSRFFQHWASVDYWLGGQQIWPLLSQCWSNDGCQPLFRLHISIFC